MQIHFHGSYRYASRESLAEAVAAARRHLEDDELDDPALATLRGFVSHGTRLVVDVVLPAAIDVRFAAAAVIETLAERAVDGSVEARHAGRQIDQFPWGTDD